MMSQLLMQKILVSNEVVGPESEKKAEGITLVENPNGFNEISRPELLWNSRHC